MVSRGQKFWTASALPVAILVGLGCQTRNFSSAVQAASHDPQASIEALYDSPRHWNATPNARVFRGSVSAISHPNDFASQ